MVPRYSTTRRGITSRSSISSSVRWPPVALDEPDGDIGAPLLAPVALVQHGVGLADPGGGTQVDAETSGCLRPVRCGLRPSPPRSRSRRVSELGGAHRLAIIVCLALCGR